MGAHLFFRIKNSWMYNSSKSQRQRATGALDVGSRALFLCLINPPSFAAWRDREEEAEGRGGVETKGTNKQRLD